jgi:UDP-glucose:(heptosyl)LPS alpha-1,3-glucosyltransferase
MVVAGKDRRAAAAQMRATAALGESLLWLGPVDDAAPVLAAADALLLPSRFDSASNAVLEALSCGVPAVASRADGSSEIVPDPAWIVADSSDARRFGDALDRAWASGERGRDAARAAVAPWTVERNARAMLDVIAAARVA